MASIAQAHSNAVEPRRVGKGVVTVVAPAAEASVRLAEPHSIAVAVFRAGKDAAMAEVRPVILKELSARQLLIAVALCPAGRVAATKTSRSRQDTYRNGPSYLQRYATAFSLKQTARGADA